MFNSSQVFKGHSLNNSWDLGPDIISNHHVEVKVVPSQDGSRNHRSVKPNHLKRHVSNLIVLIPVEEQNNDDAFQETDDQVN